jgi:hypothetical protein
MNSSVQNIPRVIDIGDQSNPRGAVEKFPSVPIEAHRALQAWAYKGIPPNSWLESLLSNDLSECMSQCPARDASIIGHIALMLAVYYPSGCHGSGKRVAEWCDPKYRSHLRSRKAVVALRTLHANSNYR